MSVCVCVRDYVCVRRECVCVCLYMRDRVIFEDISYVNAYIWFCLNMYACVSVCMRLCFE